MVIYEGSPGDAHSSSCSVAVCVVCTNDQHLTTWSWHTADVHHTHGLLLQALPGWPLTEAIYSSHKWLCKCEVYNACQKPRAEPPGATAAGNPSSSSRPPRPSPGLTLTVTGRTINTTTQDVTPNNTDHVRNLHSSILYTTSVMSICVTSNRSS